MTILGGPATFFLPGEIRQVQKRNAGAPFDFAQGRLLHSRRTMRLSAASAEMTIFWWVKGKRDDEFLVGGDFGWGLQERVSSGNGRSPVRLRSGQALRDDKQEMQMQL